MEEFSYLFPFNVSRISCSTRIIITPEAEDPKGFEDEEVEAVRLPSKGQSGRPNPKACSQSEHLPLPPHCPIPLLVRFNFLRPRQDAGVVSSTV